MRTIVFATQKGGSGKSILAACLAVAAQAAGERVFVFDLDPKKCLVRWGVKRNDRSLQVRAISSDALAAKLINVRARNASLVILDTPALDWPMSLAAINAADLAIVPVRPATFDIWASEVTGRKLKMMDKEFVFLLNQCPRAQDDPHLRECIAALEATGPVLSPAVRARNVFLSAGRTGKGVSEVEPKGEAAREMRALWLAVKRRLPPRKTQPS
ncbi:AAA family ATPase [Methylocapsa sp. D3K7]|uniref:nucleotide-binding protein n=1 Tax=Methylocapsa sp. D3K7 TaxID=3041435 RepID=UPI00244E679D|nr:AAA family ATPase [Methylocapsa sp. D3K7]WGJ15071.1 AAA family ATPase [Methylocapsa sp. D3K7]